MGTTPQSYPRYYLLYLMEAGCRRAESPESADTYDTERTIGAGRNHDTDGDLSGTAANVWRWGVSADVELLARKQGLAYQFT